MGQHTLEVSNGGLGERVVIYVPRVVPIGTESHGEGSGLLISFTDSF
jgi:hypothetical protein